MAKLKLKPDGCKILIFVFLLTPLINIAQSPHKLLRKGKVISSDFIQKLNASIINGKYIIEDVRFKNSNKTYRFILDSGSPCVVSEEVAKEIGLKEKTKGEVNDGFVTITASYGIADPILGNVEFSDIGFAVIQGLNVTGDHHCNIDGIIGNNLMSKCVWRISQDELVLASSIEKIQNKGDYVSKIKLMGQGKAYPYTMAQFGGPKGTTLIDLGDDALIEIGEHILPYVRSSKTVTGIGRMVTLAFSEEGANDSTVYTLCQTDTLRIGSKTITSPVAYVDKGTYGSTIGLGITKYFSLTLDFVTKKLYLHDELVIPEFCHKTFGFGFEINDEGHVLVRSLWNNSPAQKTGLKIGQRITRINKFDLTLIAEDIEKCEIISQILSILRNSNEIELTVSEYTQVIRLQKKSLFGN